MADDYARGDKLLYLRKKARLTQATAAYQSGFSDKTIREWEKNGPIKWANAKKYAKFLGVKDPESIVTRDLRAPVEPEDIDELRTQLNELLARNPKRAVDAAARANRKSQPKSRGKQPPKAKKRRAG